MVRIACIVVLTGTLFSQQTVREPYHIKQDVLGESLDDYKKNHVTEVNDCVFKDGPLGLQSHPDGVQDCFTQSKKQPLTYAGLNAEARMVIFVEGRLACLMMSFRESDYDALKNALTDKFGKPSGVSSDYVQNRMGAQFVNDTSTWQNGIATVYIEHYSSDLDHTNLNFYLDSLADKAHRKHPGKARSDM